MLIGLFRENHPLNSLPEERVKALAKEALRQNIELILFDSKSVNFRLEQIKGKWFDGEKWNNILSPFPRVMINELPRVVKKRTDIENKLREKIQCTTFLIAGKEGIYKYLNRHSTYKDLVIPTRRINELKDIDDALHDYGDLVIKPVGGRQGKGIFFIRKKFGFYILKDNDKNKLYKKKNFIKYIKQALLQSKYIAQPYIHCRTKEGEPYDFRIHVQRNGEGKWVVTKTYPRIGVKKSILSNISRGGRTEEISSFLEKEYGHEANSVLEEIESIGIGISDFIDRQYKFTIDELGIDLAIDGNGKMWLYEVNTGPQTKYHEEERAVNTIAYAKYLTKRQQISLEKAPIVALLTGVSRDSNLKRACYHVAMSKDVQFFYFTPKGLRSNFNAINGYTYEGGKRKFRRFPYPEAIYDRLRMRGIKNYKDLYETLSSIPFTNNRNGDSVSKEEMYGKLVKQKRFNNYLIPYQPINSYNTLIKFISTYKKVIIKHNKGSYGNSIYLIERGKGHYKLVYKEDIKYLNAEEFNKFYNRVWRTNHVVQKYITSKTKKNESFDIRVHLVLDGNKEWQLAKVYARIGKGSSITSNISSGGYIMDFETFLISNIDKIYHERLKLEIKYLSEQLSDNFHELYQERINEIGLDIAIDEECKLWLFEININKPDTIFHEYEVAKYAIPYAIALINKGANT